jgi:hypothetical protein
VTLGQRGGSARHVADPTSEVARATVDDTAGDPVTTG